MKDIPLREIDLKFIRLFEYYLKTDKKNSHNSSDNRIKNLKMIVNIAIENDIIKKDPFFGYKFRIEKTETEFLTREELDRLIQKESLIPRLETVRDIFVFCCFTGLAFCDIHQLSPCHLQRDDLGNLWIRKHRQKTNATCAIPIIKAAEELI